MAKVRQLVENGVEFLPVTHEDAVFDTNGVSVGKKLIDLKNTKIDRIENSFDENTNENIIEFYANDVLSKEVKIKVGSLDTEDIDLTDYQRKVDDSLTTNSKIIVGAINENKTNIGKIETVVSTHTQDINDINSKLENVNVDIEQHIVTSDTEPADKKVLWIDTSANSIAHSIYNT